MSPQDVISRLFSDKGVTLARLAKAQGLALRSKVAWERVIAAMTAEQKQAVDDAR